MYGKKFHIQGVTAFQGQDYTNKYSEFLKNCYKALDVTFCSAVKLCHQSFTNTGFTIVFVIITGYHHLYILQGPLK
jgi:hypothetical protein